MEKCLLAHWCNYLSWINSCSQAGVPSPLRCVPGAVAVPGVYLGLLPRAVYLGSGRGNFSLWHPPPIQHLRIYVNILAVVAEMISVVTPPNSFFHRIERFLDRNFATFHVRFKASFSLKLLLLFSERAMLFPTVLLYGESAQNRKPPQQLRAQVVCCTWQPTWYSTCNSRVIHYAMVLLHSFLLSPPC